MPAFNAEVPHTIGQEDATKRLKRFLDLVAEHYKDQVSALEGNWVDNVLQFSLTTYGFTISGDLVVEEEIVKLDGQLPFAAVPFKGKIQQSIVSELERALG